MNCSLRNACPSEPGRVTSNKSALSSQRHPAYKRAYKSPSLINLPGAQMTTTASTLTEIPQGDMHVTQCVHLGATLDLRFMVDFQPEEALEPRVLYVVAEQVSDASRCAQFLLDRREGNESVHLTRAGNTLTVTSAGGISMDIAAGSFK